GPGYSLADYLWHTRFDAGQRVRGIWRGDYRPGDWGCGGLFRGMVRSFCKHRADQSLLVVPGDFAGDCVCGVSGSGNQQSDSRAGGYWVGRIRATGAGADFAGEGNGIRTSGAVAGRDTCADFGTALIAEYSAACV